MGCSEEQFAIISVILGFLYKNLPENKYFIATNEAAFSIWCRKSNLVHHRPQKGIGGNSQRPLDDYWLG